MIKHALKTLVVAAALTLAAATAAQAQTGESVVVRIPFEFHVGDKAMPAGEYSIGPASQNPSRALSVRAVGGRAAKVVLTDAAEPEARGAHARLEFQRYGDQYFLRRVTTGDTARALPASALEREAERDAASPQRIGLARSTVAVYVRRK